MGGNLNATKLLTRSSQILTGVGVFILVAGVLALMRRSVVSNKVTTSITCIIVAIFTSVSLGLQVLALDKIHDEGGICDRDEYYPNGWYDRFPLHSFPGYAYFKFFNECKMGHDAHRARQAIVINCFTCACALISAIVLLMQIPNQAREADEDLDNKGISNVMGHFPVKHQKLADISDEEEGTECDSAEAAADDLSTSHDDASVSHSMVTGAY